MPKVMIENVSAAPQGVQADGALAYVMPKQSKTLTVSDADLEGLRVAAGANLIKLTMIDPDAQPTADVGAPGSDPAPEAGPVAAQPVEAAPAAPAAVVEASPPAPAAPEEAPKAVDDMTDEELRSLISDLGDGNRPHPNTGRPTLLAKARVLRGE